MTYPLIKILDTPVGAIMVTVRIEEGIHIFKVEQVKTIAGIGVVEDIAAGVVGQPNKPKVSPYGMPT